MSNPGFFFRGKAVTIIEAGGKRSTVMKKVLCFLAIIAAFSGTAFAQVDSFLNPVDDAYTWYLHPDSNFGIENRLITNDNFQSFLKFDLSGLNTIENAALWLYNFRGPDNDVSVYETTDGWNQADITWNTQPALGDFVSSTTVGAKGWYSWDITSYAQAAQGAGADYLSLALISGGKGTSNREMFRSEEASRDSRHPYVAVTATPEPISAGLFLLGGGALAVIRRKKA